MKHILYIVCIALTSVGFAQNKLSKPKQTIKTDKQTEIFVNTSHVNLELDTWNKDYIEIEGFVESSQLDKEALQAYLDQWNLNIEVKDHKVIISSKEQGGLFYTESQNLLGDTNLLLEELELNLSNMPIIELEDMEYPLLNDLSDLPELPEFPELPELPELKNGNYNFSFDVEKYRENGSNYLKEWSKDFASKYGNTYKKEMEAWAKKVSEMDLDAYRVEIKKFTDENKNRIKEMKKMRTEKRKEISEKRKVLRENAQQKRVIVLKEKVAKLNKMRAKERKKQKEVTKALLGTISRSGRGTIFKTSNNENVIKTIKIKVPKKAKVKLDVQHGELILASTMTDLQADLAYTKLNANRINGAKTSINTSYSNINVNYWSKGDLNLSYVEDAKIETADVLNLKANASHVLINNLITNSTINHKFGDLTIKQLSEQLKHLTVTVQGSDALISLPKNNYKLKYFGEQSKFNNQRINTKTVDKNSVDNDKLITINAKFSNVYTN